MAGTFRPLVSCGCSGPDCLPQLGVGAATTPEQPVIQAVPEGVPWWVWAAVAIGGVIYLQRQQRRTRRV